MKKMFIFIVGLMVSFMATVQVITGVDQDVIGHLETTLHGTNQPGSTLEETELGDVIADAVRTSTGAQLSIIPGGIIQSNLIAGDLTIDDINQIFNKYCRLVIANITPAELFRFLEFGVSKLIVGEGDRIDQEQSKFYGYPQISGISVRCDVSAPVGQRILNIFLEDGSQLEREDEMTQLRVGTIEEMADGSLGYPELKIVQTCETSIQESMVQYCAGKNIVLPESDRMIIIGSLDYSIISKIPAGMLFLY